MSTRRRASWLLALGALGLVLSQAPTAQASTARTKTIFAHSGVEMVVTHGTFRPGTVPATLGSCSGYSNWVERTQYENNAYGSHLAWIKLHTNFCYNYSRVTYATSYRSAGTTELGNIGGIEWQGWQSYSEAWYTVNGHINGGAYAITQAKFGDCPIHVGCIAYVYPQAETLAHYDGGWNTWGKS